MENNQRIEDIISDVFKWTIEDIDLQDSTICDIGVGNGLSSIYFASKGAKKVYGVEPSEGKGFDKSAYDLFVDNIKRFKKEDIVIPQKIDFLQNNYEDNSFDFVFAINSLHHVIETTTDKSNFEGIEQRLLEAFNEIKRITKPNGKAIIWDIAFDSIFRFLKIRYKQFDWYLHPPLKIWKNAAKQSYENLSFEYSYFLSIPASKYVMRNYMSLFFLNPTFKLTLVK